MKEIFISYSTKDQVQADTVRNVLENNDIPCWMAPSVMRPTAGRQSPWRP